MIKRWLAFAICVVIECVLLFVQYNYGAVDLRFMCGTAFAGFGLGIWFTIMGLTTLVSLGR